MKLSYIAIAVVTVSLVGCKANKTATIIGGDSDRHGCIGSAGYQWSEVKQDCIRIFESGTQLTSINDKLSSFAAYIIFSNDSTKVEAFIPDIKESRILRKQGEAGYWSENPKFSGAYKLTHEDGVWTLSEGNTPIYISKK
ncbi:MAG: hypothetical protein RR061_08135 [Muribaculaceae bacterium]